MSPRKLLKDLVKANPSIKVADVESFIRHYSRTDSALTDELSRAKAMFGISPTRRKVTPAPPAGLRAKEAIPIVLAYVREEKSRPVSLSKQERGSFAAMTEALDRQFGKGFTQRVVDELNAIPNGSQSLHYRR